MFDTRILISKQDSLRALNLIIKSSISYKNCKRLDSGEIEIIISASSVKKVKSLFSKYNVSAEFYNNSVPVKWLKAHKHRAGLLVGLIITLIVSLAFTNFVCEINIHGNSRLTDGEVLEALEASGFSLGTYIPNIDYKKLHNKVLLNCKDISWISVNITGNVANVEIKESIFENTEVINKYTNVVAAADGQIASINVIEGKAQVKIGDVVKKGDLLISGVIDSNSQGVRYTSARGEVKAYVNKQITIEIPLKQAKKVYANKPIKDIGIKIFNKNIFFSRKYRNLNGLYDTIEKSEQIMIFGKISLPINTLTKTYYVYELKEIIITPAQAVDIAFAELRGELDKELKNAEMISKNVSVKYDENCYYLTCDLYCLEDIAINKEFTLENNGG